jgi:Glycosyl transferase family 2
MVDAPYFTVVVSTFNRGLHIIPTIESALDQSFADFELLVVGDGVTDDTLDRVPKNDARVRVISLPVNSGSQASPNNAGIAAARGRHIAYLGHDDIWMPDHLAALAELFESTGCDVAVSGCAYHGPPGTDLIQVTGLFADPADARRHFFPPTSLAHRRALVEVIGNWRDPQTVSAPVDADFPLRAVAAGARFVSTGRITAHKFAAGHRYLSYLNPSSSEQNEMLAAIRSGAIDRQACANFVERAKAAGSYMGVRHPNYSWYKPGELYHRNRSNKGIERVPATALTTETYVAQSMEPRALDWYRPERSWLSLRRFRWSGPSLRPKLLIPFFGNTAARIVLHFRDIDPARVIDELRVTLNGNAIEHKLKRARRGQIDLELVGPLLGKRSSVVELILPRSFCPAEINGSGDARRLGLILKGFTIAPVEAAFEKRDKPFKYSHS